MEKEKQSFKPMLFGIILIAAVIGIYAFRNGVFDKKNSDSSDNNKLEQEETSPTVKYISAEKTKDAIVKNDSQLIDIRLTEFYTYEHIESSINFPLESEDQLGQLPNFLDKQKQIIVIDQQDSTLGKKFCQQLEDAGFRALYLRGGMVSYLSQGYNAISIGDPESGQDKAKVIFISPEETNKRLKEGEIFKFLDVRKKEDYKKYYIEGSKNIPLELLEKNKSEIPSGKIIVVDENPIRSFQAAVRLYDMNFVGVYCLSENLNKLEEINQPENEPAPETQDSGSVQEKQDSTSSAQ